MSVKYISLKKATNTSSAEMYPAILLPSGNGGIGNENRFRETCLMYL